MIDDYRWQARPLTQQKKSDLLSKISDLDAAPSADLGFSMLPSLLRTALLAPRATAIPAAGQVPFIKAWLHQYVEAIPM
jgi:hypothetical protein